MLIKLTGIQKGMFALAISALFGALMGVWVRIMNQELGLYQQIFARGLMAVLLGLVFYRRKLGFKKIIKTPRKDLLLVVFRSALLLIGISLYTKAILIAKYSNIGFIFSLPMTAVLGLLLLREKVTIKKVGLILLGFIGVVILSVKDYSDLLEWGQGEILMLIATVFYALSYIARKWISPFLNNQELSEVGYAMTATFAIIAALIFGQGLFNPIDLELTTMVAIFFAGIGYLVIGLGVNYGFQKVEAVVGNNFLMLEAVFALVISILVYSEIPTLLELFGGVLVIMSAYLMNKVMANS